MKQIIYTIAISLGILTQTFAQEKLDAQTMAEMRTEELAKTVELTNQQIPAVQAVINETTTGLREQFKESDELINAVARALQAEQTSMRGILTPTQFKVYLQDQAEKTKLLEEIFGVKVSEARNIKQKTSLTK